MRVEKAQAKFFIFLKMELGRRVIRAGPVINGVRPVRWSIYLFSKFRNGIQVSVFISVMELGPLELEWQWMIYHMNYEL